jgi:hypothetical protein
MSAVEDAAQACPKCKTTFQDATCPNCDGEALSPTQTAANALRPYQIVNALTFVFVVAICWGYPLLDRTKFFLIGTALIGAPNMAFYLRNAFADPLSAFDLSIAKKLQVCAGIALAVFLILLVCNCTLDRSLTETQATVISKQVVTGRRTNSKSYFLVVESWRPGRTSETLSVDAGTYYGATQDSVVTIDVHKGLFGWPWYAGVEMRSFNGTRGFSDGLHIPSN